MEKPRISLVIPAYNEEKYLARSLESVVKAREAYYRPSLIEVIVADNGSTDNTRKIARSFGADVVLEMERRIASVRNKGAASATGDIVGFLDADSLVTPNIFNSIDEVMSSGRYIGGGTDVRVERSSLGILCTYGITVVPAKHLLGVMGGLIFTTREAFEEIGGFDTSLYCAEDSKFILSLKKYGKRHGKKFKIITDAFVTTSSRAFDKFGDWYYFKNLPRIALKAKTAFRDMNISGKFWYYEER